MNKDSTKESYSLLSRVLVVLALLLATILAYIVTIIETDKLWKECIT